MARPRSNPSTPVGEGRATPPPLAGTWSFGRCPYWSVVSQSGIALNSRWPIGLVGMACPLPPVRVFSPSGEGLTTVPRVGLTSHHIIPHTARPRSPAAGAYRLGAHALAGCSLAGCSLAGCSLIGWLAGCSMLGMLVACAPYARGACAMACCMQISCYHAMCCAAAAAVAIARWQRFFF